MLLDGAGGRAGHFPLDLGLKRAVQTVSMKVFRGRPASGDGMRARQKHVRTFLTSSCFFASILMTLFFLTSSLLAKSCLCLPGMRLSPPPMRWIVQNFCPSLPTSGGGSPGNPEP